MANTSTQSQGDSAACPQTGLWALCSVENRLKRAGFVARRVPGEAPRRPGFSIPAAVYALGRARLEVFLYPSSAELARDAAKLDTVSVAPPFIAGPWSGTPTFIRSGNLAAVYIGEDRRQAERLMNALTAGAPQPP